MKKLNELLILLNEQPVRQLSNLNYKTNCDLVIGALRKKVFKRQCDCEDMINNIKTQFSKCSKTNDKIRILSILPCTWTSHRIKETFNCSWNIAEKVTKLRQVSGIPLEPVIKTRQCSLPDQTIQLVKDMFRCEEISRIMPGKKDFVTIRENGTKSQVQKRLLLVTLNEAYQLFKEKFPDVKV